MSRTHVKNASIVFTIPLNSVMTQLTIPGSIYSMTKSTTNTGRALQQFCPDCQSPIGHRLFCKDQGHGPFQRDEVLRGRLIDGEKVAIVEDADEVVTSEIARGKLSLTLVDRESLIQGTTPNDKTYHFMPTPADTGEAEAYVILHSAITDNPNWAFVCRANIGRGAETLLSVESGAFGGLTLQTLAYPETLYDLPVYELPTVTKKRREGIRMLLAEQVEEFDPDEWADLQAEAVSNAVDAAAKRRGKPASKKVKPKKAASLFDAIEAAAKAS